MALNITVAGVSYPVPSSAVDTNWAAQQVALLQALAATINARAPSFVTPALINSWANKGSGFQTLRYYVDEWGQLFLEGALASGTSGTVAFVLANPPKKAQSFVVLASAGFATVDIDTSGNVTITNFASGNANIFVSLSGITFNIN